MGRWAEYEEDEHRLPDGMRRIGYDSDNETYTYQDEDGSFWEGAPGNRYGQLRRVSGSNHAYEPPSEQPLKFRRRESPWRYLGPFFLLICLFLLGMFHLLGGSLWSLMGAETSAVQTGSTKALPDTVKVPIPECTAGTKLYKVRKGDTCWDISKAFRMSVQELESVNSNVDCDELPIGQEMCVKDEKRQPQESTMTEGKGGSTD